MAKPIVWSDAMDAQMRRLRKAGTPWPAIADVLRIGRSACIERGRSLGLVGCRADAKPIAAPPPRPKNREALPAGSPENWGLITRGTVLDGSVFGPGIS